MDRRTPSYVVLSGGLADCGGQDDAQSTTASASGSRQADASLTAASDAQALEKGRRRATTPPPAPITAAEPPPTAAPADVVPNALQVVSNNRKLYVSPSGNDSNDGLSEAQPVQTIQRGVDLAMPGDTVLVRNGTYAFADANDNIVTLRRSGTPTAWISLKAYPGEAPLLKSANWHAISVATMCPLVFNGTSFDAAIADNLTGVDPQFVNAASLGQWAGHRGVGGALTL